MIYASSKDRFKRELDGIQIELQVTDPTEMGLDVFKSRANWDISQFPVLHDDLAMLSVLLLSEMLIVCGPVNLTELWYWFVVEVLPYSLS